MAEIEQNPSERVCHEPKSDGRTVSSPLNGRCGGAPRGSGFKQIDFVKWDRLFLGGASDKAIADALGISYRTFVRRKHDRWRQQESASD